MTEFSHKVSFIFKMVAISIIAAILVSCAPKLQDIDSDQISEAPTQVIKNMNATQTDKGIKQMRLETPLMERYEMSADSSKEFFPEGIEIFVYDEVGKLETEIVSDKAMHTQGRTEEIWSAFGNVVIKNYIQGERIDTDTLYWNKEAQQIYTDCYVKLASPQGFMQGYGLMSDERARNAQLLKPFDSYGIVSNDSTSNGYIDTVNLIGPKK